MKYEYYDQYINKKTKGRKDILPIFNNSKIFSNLLSDLAKPFKKRDYNKIAGLDALGFIMGGALAQKKNIGFIALRKGGKVKRVRGTGIKRSFKDYSKTKKEFDMCKKSIKKGDKILLVDDWIETGTQMKAAIKIIEKLGGKIFGISVICSHKNKKTKILFDKYNLKALKIIKN